MIIAKDFIKTGFSEEDAKPILNAIENIISKEPIITIDFNGIRAFTTLFFNNALGKFFLDLGPEDFERKFKLENLSETGNVTYEHFLKNSKQFYEMKKLGKTDSYNKIVEENEVL